MPGLVHRDLDFLQTGRQIRVPIRDRAHPAAATLAVWLVGCLLLRPAAARGTSRCAAAVSNQTRCAFPLGASGTAPELLKLSSTWNLRKCRSWMFATTVGTEG
jgi:hypothetical protein